MTDTVSAAPSDLDIDATWDALPGIRIHNDANARGLDTQTMLRRAFARAVLAKWGAQPAPASQGDAQDAARLDWLLLHISGAEFRRIGVHYSGNARRADVDAARKQGENHD